MSSCGSRRKTTRTSWPTTLHSLLIYYPVLHYTCPNRGRVSFSLSLSLLHTHRLNVYICIYIYVYVCICVYVCIYMLTRFLCSCGTRRKTTRTSWPTTLHSLLIYYQIPYYTVCLNCDRVLLIHCEDCKTCPNRGRVQFSLSRTHTLTRYLSVQRRRWI